MGLVVAVGLLTVFTASRLRRPPRKTYGAAVSRGLPGEPSELDRPRAFEAFEVDLGGPGGTPVWSIAGDEPSGPIVIATPGWGDSRVGMLMRLGGGAGPTGGPGLATAARRVIAWDPPGQGEARGPCALGVREPTMLLRLIEQAAEIDAAAAGAVGEARDGGATGMRAGSPAVVLFGSSLGAGVSIAAAAAAKRDRARWVGASAGVAGVIAEAPYRLPMTPARNVIRGAGYPTFTLGAVYAWFALRLGVGRTVRWERAHGDEPFDRAHHARGLGVPLLVLHGGEDRVSPLADAQEIAAAAADGSVIDVAGAGHNDLWTDGRFRPTAGEAVESFIRRVGAVGAESPAGAPV
jgi:pimeloyl-ACP methyl ester carboxylesterase